MARFHRLQIIDGVPTFIEVAGELIEIGEGIQAFFIRPPSGIWPCLYDVPSGARITDVCETDIEARVVAEALLKESGILRWRDNQMAFSAKYGLPPEVIEIIQEPQGPGEIETCRRETSCGHH